MTENESNGGGRPVETKVAEVRDLREAELQMTGHAPVATQFAGWGAMLPPDAQGEQVATTNSDQTTTPSQATDQGSNQ